MKLSDVNWTIAITFVCVHALVVFGLVTVGLKLEYFWWFAGTLCIRWLGFTCAVHRYFSHRVCRTSRIFQFVLAIWGTLTMARSPIKFASGHRHHHLHSDRRRDLHSPRHGIFMAYLGWVISKKYDERKLGLVGDLLRFPELRWINRLYFLPNLLVLAPLYVVGGLPAVVYGGGLSIIGVWHLAFSVTVLFHRVGSTRYETYDQSRNSNMLGFLTFGEGWHNNHHANMASAKIGHEWYQIDLGYLVLRFFESVGLVWDLNKSVGQKILLPNERRAKAEIERGADSESTAAVRTAVG